MVQVAVIGCGYWGPNLVRNLMKVPDCRVVAVADLDPARLAALGRLYPALRMTTVADDVLSAPDIDAVAIATPLSTHHPLARVALERGKHVLLEKPMTATVAEGEELIRLSAASGRVLMVDHTFVYTGAVRKIRELIRNGELGEIYYYDAVRINLGLFQHDINVLWDLAPHDFSIMSYLLDKAPVRVSAVGAAPVRWDGWKLESIVYVTMELDGGTLAHVHVNWLSPVKIRRTLIGGSKKIVVYDHLDPDNQVKIFDRGVEILADRDRYRMLVQYRTGDMLVPKIDQTEALESVCHHFVECILTGARPLSDGQAGLQVVRLLEAAQRSLEESRTRILA
ncbi:MAG TPA: Gfo/Idh/MocA family oxidoreductase [bacterium]|nr:Gfo/Idh/MocA family oxidoreductase [bacterium]